MQDVTGIASNPRAAMPAGSPAGRSSDAVGHRAKAAVAAAREAGAELPRNAQGKAASAIARGADPASLFQARIASAGDAAAAGQADSGDPAPSPDVQPAEPSAASAPVEDGGDVSLSGSAAATDQPVGTHTAAAASAEPIEAVARIVA